MGTPAKLRGHVEAPDEQSATSGRSRNSPSRIRSCRSGFSRNAELMDSTPGLTTRMALSRHPSGGQVVKKTAFLNKFDHVTLFQPKMRNPSFIILSSTASWIALPQLDPDTEKTERPIC
jgi:hypothetical protein